MNTETILFVVGALFLMVVAAECIHTAESFVARVYIWTFHPDGHLWKVAWLFLYCLAFGIAVFVVWAIKNAFF